MDYKALAIIIDNDRTWSGYVLDSITVFLDSRNALPGQANGTSESLDLCKATGEEVISLVRGVARREHRIDTDNYAPGDLTAMVLGTALGHISTEHLGEHYIIRARESYQED